MSVASVGGLVTVHAPVGDQKAGGKRRGHHLGVQLYRVSFHLCDGGGRSDRFQCCRLQAAAREAGAWYCGSTRPFSYRRTVACNPCNSSRPKFSSRPCAAPEVITSQQAGVLDRLDVAVQVAETR